MCKTPFADGDVSSHVLFLSWESPWPAFSGGALRTLGLLKEISKVYPVHLMVLSQETLSKEQEKELAQYAYSLTWVPRSGATLRDKLEILARMFIYQMPYHCALLVLSFRRDPQAMKQIESFPGVVYATPTHWGTLARGREALHWILDQHDADVQIWKVTARQTSNIGRKLAALLNLHLATKHFPSIYSNVGCVVSVCQADQQLTLDLAPQAKVVVIENGVDCSYYIPNRESRSDSPRVLFTGTSAPRNMTVLRRFCRDIWPLIQQELPETELLVAGNFKPKAQIEFKQFSKVCFTGKVEDMRPYFNQSDVFVSPFEEAHGSKLKIAEAMAMGMAIVSTSEGIRGFPLIDGESVLISHSDERFAALVVNLLKDVTMREKLGDAARCVALATVDWQVLGKRLIELIQRTQESLLQ